MISRVMFLRVGAVLLLALLFNLGCSSDSDGPLNPGSNDTSEVIGEEGGIIEIDDAVIMTLPAGAVDSDITFTMADAGSEHEDMVAVRALGSAVYSIGPAGTTFNEPVELTLHYNEDDLNGIAESEIIIYTDDGGGWTALSTTVDEVNNVATAEIYHLSDFVVTIPAGEAADGVYAIFEVVRWASYTGGEPGDNLHTDMLVARFDEVVNMCNPVLPLFADSVYCNTYPMSYDDMLLAYMDENVIPDFLTLGEEYTFHVLASDDVPAFTRSITMVGYEPVMTNIMDMDPVSMQGFTVEWNDFPGGDVSLALVHSAGGYVVTKDLPNNGSYTFTEEDLGAVTPGMHALILTHYNKEFIDDVEGIDPQSHILSMTMDTKLVVLSTNVDVIGPDGGSILLGDDGRLTIPAGVLTENVEFTSVVNEDPAVTLDYAFLTPVYTLGPDGLVFNGNDATLLFYYDEGDIGDGIEEDIVILCDSGDGWEELDSFAFEDENYVEADLGHLSDYVAAIPITHTAEGVYAEVSIDCSGMDLGSGMTRADILKLRFDEVVDEEAVSPLQAESATFGEWAMDWVGYEDEGEYFDQYYSYFDFGGPAFLTAGQTYDLTVVGGSTAVPSAVLQVPFETAPMISNIQSEDTVPLTGFTLEWEDFLVSTEVDIILRVGATGLFVTVANTGSYTFSEAELSALGDEGLSFIQIVYEAELPLVADGFDSASKVIYFTSSTVGVTFSE